MLRFGAECSESLTRKVFKIERDDHACAATNRGGEDVSIATVRQLNDVDQRIVSNHQRVRECFVHQAPGTFPFLCEVRAILEKITHPFLVNIGKPICMETACQ